MAITILYIIFPVLMFTSYLMDNKNSKYRKIGKTSTICFRMTYLVVARIKLQLNWLVTGCQCGVMF